MKSKSPLKCKILLAMITHDEFLKRVRSVISPQRHFADNKVAKTIVDWCFDYFDRYGKAPKDHIRDYFDKYADERDDGDAVVEMIGKALDSIAEQAEYERMLNIDFLVDETEKFCRGKDIEQMAKDARLLAQKGDVESAYELLQKGLEKLSGGSSKGASMQGHTAKELLGMDLRERQFLVPNILSIGGNLVVGPPKIGKSWLALQIGLETAYGGRFFGESVHQGDVLYLALEDSFSRIKKRLQYVLNELPAPDNFHLHIEWSRVGAGGIEAIEDFLKDHPNTKLIIVDTLERIRPARKSGANPYGEDYAAIAALKSLADKHEITIVIVHHIRKGESRDFIETVSGTYGLTAAADTILVLKRNRGQSTGTLHITGRDVEEQELAVEFNEGRWKSLGDVEETGLTPERMEIIKVLEESASPMSPTEIAKRLEKSVSTVRVLVRKMDKCGMVRRDSYGLYIPTNSINSINSSIEENKQNKQNLRKIYPSSLNEKEHTVSSFRKHVLKRAWERSFEE